MTTFGFYSPAIGREGSSIYRPRKDFTLTVEARHEAEALTKVAEILGVPRAQPMARTLPILGLGSLKAEARS
jgi:hypothetical protein